MRRSMALCLALLISLPTASAPAASKKKTPHTRSHPPALIDPDKNLLDYSIHPFSDQGSHVALMQLPGAGLMAWEMLDASASGASASMPRRMLKWRLEIQVQGERESYFAPTSGLQVETSYFPHWVIQKTAQAGLSAEAGLAFVETDGLVFACTLTNKSKKTLSLRPRLVLETPAGTAVARDLRTGRLTAGDACFRMEAGEKFRQLAPERSLRIPVALALGKDRAVLAVSAERLFTRWALPKSKAMSLAKARWNLSSLSLPKPPQAGHARLLRKAALLLQSSRYGRRAALKTDLFSQAKGYADSFRVDTLPAIALGWSELDLGVAESALLELCSMAADKDLSVPVALGEDLQGGDSAGLPTHGWAAWELYQRDPDASRAGIFLGEMGRRLRHECAWWPENRDGDGNGLYAFKKGEEAQDLGHPQPIQVGLATYSVALSSFVGWHLQLASALAGLLGKSDESAKVLAQSRKTAEALKREARLSKPGPPEDLDKLLPFLMGLDSDPIRARAALAPWLAQAQDPGQLPFVERGSFSPWRAYLGLRTLALYGYGRESRMAAEKILAFLEDKPCFSAYEAASGKGLGVPGDAQTAAAILEIAMERYSQDAFWLADTTQIEARLVTFRSPDGGFFMKRRALPFLPAAYAPILLTVAAEGLKVRASEDSPMNLTSRKPMTLTDSKGKQLAKRSLQLNLVFKAGIEYLLKLENN